MKISRLLAVAGQSIPISYGPWVERFLSYHGVTGWHLEGMCSHVTSHSGWWQKSIGGIDFDQVVSDLVHKCQSCPLSSLLQCWPIEIFNHIRNRCCVVVTVGHISSRTTLYHFQFLFVLLQIWVPGGACIL